MALTRTPALTFLPLALVLSAPMMARAQTNSLPFTGHRLFEVVGSAAGIDPELLEAIAFVESAGRADAVSPKGASGLMQLMPDTARRFGVKHPFDPVENVLGGARFLSYLREYAGIEDLPQLLAAYNAGEGAISRYRGLPPFPETREYVRRVLITYLLSDELGPKRADSVTSYRPSGSPISRLMEAPPATPLSGLTQANIVKRRTEADVFAQLDQIRRARRRALQVQQGLGQAK